MDLLIHTKHNLLMSNNLDQIWFWKNIPITSSQGCISYTFPEDKINSNAALFLRKHIIEDMLIMQIWCDMKVFCIMNLKNEEYMSPKIRRSQNVSNSCASLLQDMGE